MSTATATATATALDIKKHLLEKQRALGNSNRGIKEICSDLLNAYGKDNLQTVQNGTFLCRQTLERMMSLDETENGEPYRPNADTCERILKFFNAELSLNYVKISPRFLPKPKL